jgi:hypothetical protein
LIVNDVWYPPQGSIGNFVNTGGETEGNFLQISDGRIVADEGDVIKYKLIVKGVEIDE